MSGQTAVPITCNETHDLLSAYALGALEPEEQRMVAQHLAICMDCRQRLAVFDAVTDALLTAPAPIAPPPALRERLMRSIQEPAPPARASSRGILRAQDVVMVKRWVVAAVAAVLVALLVGAGVLTNLVVQTRSERAEAVAAERKLAQYLAAGGRVITLTSLPASDYGDSIGRGRLITAPGLPPLVVVNGCPPSSAQRVYRVWVARGQERTRIGELFVRDDGTGWMEVQTPEPLTEFDRLGVTMETGSGVRWDILVGSIPHGTSAFRP
ncbi:MAG: hypothetical protein KatS3mg059_0121 [Thermomicrobiales bacterium]|nr:MAG: hypothetical protein KatS3mg059_0121 [Thermomicrobiales bacterium]